MEHAHYCAHVCAKRVVESVLGIVKARCQRLTQVDFNDVDVMTNLITLYCALHTTLKLQQ